MITEHYAREADERLLTKPDRLENYHRRRSAWVVWVIFFGFVGFVYWAWHYKIDEVARASGEVIASSRVQVIQSVDGGVLSKLNVREGDRVNKGDVLAELDQTRIGAAVREVEARLNALKAKATRLRAEVTGAKKLNFPKSVKKALPEQAKVEAALFKQRRTGLNAEIRTLKVAIQLAKEEQKLILQLKASGDANQSEILKARRSVNDAEAKLVNRKNQFLEDARVELTRVEDEISQNEQILAQRKQQLADSVLIALVPGIVKNVRVTTIGGVLKSGEELMQIIPVDDDLIIEAKVSPADIARVKTDLEATVRFDPFDYTIYGGVKAQVVYVSADTLKEDSRQGEEIYYRVHLTPSTQPVTTTSGRKLSILPGMTAQIDIRTGDRTIMDFLLKPLRKTLSESFGER